jgi:hypothetical protein
MSGAPHAFSTDGKNFFLTGGGHWAWLEENWLYAAQGGQPLGWFSENYFFDRASGRATHFLGT